ncbi:alpha/beta hydrolase [Halorientalis sp. IM1011]|uniref:alpha/beta fold hydrolase n=1 Tax=Halorientalis sp. IM1011 TaxID=1932360 RepID=UPI00097CD6CB|nr:alpha/beta hydrolase [Halorientalis sp. IM1011]AQL42965.1 alpha/beta hydrolase [Halorientalis sp. IM1011]
MPTATNDGVELFYETAGDGPTVAFVNPAGYGAWCWSWLVEELAGPVETLVWDLRGTGRSDAPPGPYDVATLAADFEAVLSDHGARTTHLVGAGLGGMVALEYARKHGRAASLALLGTTADGSRVDADALAALQAPRDDPEALRASLRGAFSSGVVENHPEAVDRIVEWRAEDDADAAEWDAQRAAMTEFEADALYEVTTPALVVHGREDAVVPVAAGRDLADDLPRGTFEGIDAGNLVAAEEPAVVADLLAGHLDEYVDSEY